LTADITRKQFCCGPIELLPLLWASKRRHDMKAFAARGLTE
jgi:hypothetical protein